MANIPDKSSGVAVEQRERTADALRRTPQQNRDAFAVGYIQQTIRSDSFQTDKQRLEQIAGFIDLLDQVNAEVSHV